MFDSGVIWKGEIICWSLSGIEGLSKIALWPTVPEMYWQEQMSLASSQLLI